MESYVNLISKLAIRYPERSLNDLLYNEPCTLERDVLYIDTYGHGCVSNSRYNPYRAKLIKQGVWNNPCPKPANLLAVLCALRAGGFKRIVLGHRSEIVPWMDTKYGILKEVISLIRTLCPTVPVTIKTSSDLIARDDYMSALSKLHNYDRNRLKIQMRANTSAKLEREVQNERDRVIRKMEPGSASLKRRSLAIGKLDKAGFRIKRVSVRSYARTSDLK